MSELVGRDPATGGVIRVRYADGVITALERVAESGGDLPWLAPGLVDLQVNGYAGHDVNGTEASVDAVVAITERLASEGVTTWVPTIITASQDAISHSLEVIAQAIATDERVAAAVPFAHVEGPFISDQDGPRGAHPLAQVRPIDAAEVAHWQTAGPLGYVTVSPHWDDSAAQIAAIRALGIEVAIGHTHADPGQIAGAVDAGATLSTHLGNGIFANLPRHPNPIWTQLAEDRLTCGFIGDGFHLPNAVLTVMLRAVGRDRGFLVSDSVALAGSPPGRYANDIGGEVEITPDGLITKAGTGLLAGSGVNLAQVLSNVFNHTPFSLAEVLDRCTRLPADVAARLGASPRGRLRPGLPADLIELDDRAQVVGVIRAGERLR